MTTLKLKVNERILDKVLWLLGQFKPEDLEVVHDDPNFKENQAYLKKELERYESGQAKTLSIEELDSMLEAKIPKHED